MSPRAPVKVRGGGYGLDAELARKAAERYDYDMEKEAREWLETISGMQIGDDFGEGLHDGVVLCTVANRIHPGIIKRVETKSKMPFKLMENVSAFLKACRVMGVNEFDLFETVDLFDLKDLGTVVRCIFALGRAVQRNYPEFDGPRLGVKESIKNQRSFTSDQLAEGKSIPAQQTLGSFHTMKRQTTFHANTVTLGADAAQSAYRAPPPPPPPSAEKIKQLSRFREADTFESQPEGEMSPLKISSIEQQVNELLENDDEDNKPKVKSSLPGLHSVTTSAGPSAEEEAQEWIEAVLCEKFLASFGDSLKDGVILCTLMNKIKPGLIPRIQNSPMPFKQMENVSAFVRACRSIGVAEFDLFETVDLYNQTNLQQVARCIHALGRTIQKTMPEYQGPHLGVKESTSNPRKFSEAQLRQAAAAVPVLANGSQSVMERLPFDRSASITFRSDASATGDKTPPKSKPVEFESASESSAESKATKMKATITQLSSPEPTKSLPKGTEEHARPQGPSWLKERVEALNSVNAGNVGKAFPPIGATGSVLPTRTVWS